MTMVIVIVVTKDDDDDDDDDHDDGGAWYLVKDWPGLLEAWLVLTSVKYHGNLYILIPLNQRLALTRLRATDPRMIAVSAGWWRWRV